MTQKIERLIEELKMRANELKSSLLAERETNSKLQQENDRLKADLEVLTDELSKRNAEFVELEKSVEAMKENNTVSSEVKVTKEEIDEMVKEIEYCITQLKQ